jgi:peptidoglycan/LPS O-acetylase OafA/YrhL
MARLARQRGSPWLGWLHCGTIRRRPARRVAKVWMSEIKPLTSLRGVAAMAVVMQHFSATAQTLTPQWMPSLVPHGYMAVHFFFILSGFIMSLTYLAEFQARGVKAFPGFFLKRLARIAPLNVFVLAALMLLGLISVLAVGRNIFFNSPTLGFDLPANLLMLQGLGIGNNLNAPSWSISTEFAAYLLFPLLVLLVFNRRRWIGAAAVAAALAALGYVAYDATLFGVYNMSVGSRLVQTFAQFAMGMAAYRLYASRQASGRVASDLEVASVTLALGIALVTGIDVLVSLLCPFLVVATALNRGRFCRVLSGGVPYFLGIISFSIYMIHDPFRPLAVALFHAVHPGQTSAAAALGFAFACSLVVIPFAWLSYIGVERPGRRWVRHWADMFTHQQTALARVREQA